MFVCKNNLLYIKVSDYIETIEETILVRQIDTSKIAVVEQSLSSNIQNYSVFNIQNIFTIQDLRSQSALFIQSFIY